MCLLRLRGHGHFCYFYTSEINCGETNKKDPITGCMFFPLTAHLLLMPLGSELWEYDFDLLSLVKEYVVVVLDICKQKLYDDDLCPS